jgi:predicted aminopeptidase
MGLRDGDLTHLSSLTRRGGPAPRTWSRPPTRLAWLGLLALLLLAGCNPVYVARAGWAQLGLLTAREPLHQVMTDPDTDPVTRGKLRLVWDARTFAVDSLGFRNAGDSYTTLVRLESDTLALVLSAAHQDRLAFHTWWFPITGRVPYRAYFSTSAAERARQEKEDRGFDTYLRPTAAFSTLGWFSDPVYSTVLRRDEVGVVETVLHELAHNHLFIPGQGRFNESWATFAGHAAAIEFFCRREGGGADTVKCHRARDRWEDARDVSRFLMELERDIRNIYARQDWSRDRILEAREERFARALTDFRTEVQPGLRASTYEYLAREELNNATLLSRTLYFHRLDDFHRLWAHTWGGDLRGLLEWIRNEAPNQPDPFQVLSRDSRSGRRPDPRSLRPIPRPGRVHVPGYGPVQASRRFR